MKVVVQPLYGRTRPQLRHVHLDLFRCGSREGKADAGGPADRHSNWLQRLARSAPSNAAAPSGRERLQARTLESAAPWRTLSAYGSAWDVRDGYPGVGCAH